MVYLFLEHLDNCQLHQHLHLLRTHHWHEARLLRRAHDLPFGAGPQTSWNTSDAVLWQKEGGSHLFSLWYPIIQPYIHALLVGYQIPSTC